MLRSPTRRQTSFRIVRVILPAGATTGLTQSDIFTQGDYFQVINPIANKFGVSSGEILDLNGPIVYVNQLLSRRIIYPPFIRRIPFYVVQPTDFDPTLQAMASRHGISVDTLLAVNGWQKETLFFTIGSSSPCRDQR